MKNNLKNKVLLVLSFLIISVISVACSQQSDIDDDSNDNGISDVFIGENYEAEDFNVYYDPVKELLRYEATIDKPTPCHTLNVNENILESYPVQIRLVVIAEPSDMMCADVITPETVTGEIEIDHEPGSISIFYHDEKIYSTDSLM
ncbi:MAG: hypothetical protein ACLFPQ_06290 [Candidatus Woesearchaeota archaeon]